MSEKPSVTVIQEDIPTEALSFQKRIHKENVLLYEFKNLGIAIDTTGKNQTDFPEILFGTFQNVFGENGMNQPDVKIEGVNMEYIAKCVAEVARDSGISTFWFYPYGDDEPENKERREKARLSTNLQSFKPSSLTKI